MFKLLYYYCDIHSGGEQSKAEQKRRGPDQGRKGFVLRKPKYHHYPVICVVPLSCCILYELQPFCDPTHNLTKADSNHSCSFPLFFLLIIHSDPAKPESIHNRWVLLAVVERLIRVQPNPLLLLLGTHPIQIKTFEVRSLQQQPSRAPQPATTHNL